MTYFFAMAEKLLQITATLLKTTTETYYKLRYLYDKLQQKLITNCIKNSLRITAVQIISNYYSYYKSR